MSSKRYKKLPENLKEQILSPYVSIDHNQARITMRIIDTHENLRRNQFIPFAPFLAIGALTVWFFGNDQIILSIYGKLI